MKKIVILLATTALLSGCGGGSGKKSSGAAAKAQAETAAAVARSKVLIDEAKKVSGACVPNAVMISKNETLDKTEGVNAEKKLILAAGSTVKDDTYTTITLLTGEHSSANSDISQVDPADKDDASVIDFTKNTFSEDGLVVPFKLDEKLSSKGKNVYSVSDADAKTAFEKLLKEEADQEYETCGIASAKVQFSYNEADKTVEMTTLIELFVKISEDAVTSIKSGKPPVSEEVVEETIQE